MTLMLSELGFSYSGPTPSIACRYTEVEALELAPLRDIMMLRGDLSGLLTIGVIRHGDPQLLTMQWPLRTYSNAATVLDRIVRKLAR